MIVKGAERVEYALANARRFTSASGTRVLVVASHSAVSDLTERVGDDTDVVVAFGFGREGDAMVMRVSLRSYAQFDCAAFAERFGGGGHLHAAGFAVTLAPQDPQPYTLIEKLFG